MIKSYFPVDAKIPVKLWSDSFEQGALDQITNAASLPFAFKHVAMMPDGHQGFGAPIGGVLATKGVIIPNFVGMDIGCGMIARKLNLPSVLLGENILKQIIGEARKLIPVGFSKNLSPIDWSLSLSQGATGWKGISQAPIVCINEYVNSMSQVGTLGGGNHFVEIQTDEEGFTWLMIHSGSRNLGKKICDYYNAIAVDLNKKYHSSVPAEWDLAFLPIDSNEGKSYWNEMQFALDFAKINRQVMMENLFKIFVDIFPRVAYTNEINAHHNYCALEKHYGEDVYVHRKGAIKAEVGQLGIIPGSMGTPSYIVEGLGNAQSFYSASHGAGRKMGRNEFNKSHTVEQADKSIEGVVFGRWGKDRKGNVDISECPLAYKDIQTVMENQKDLVTPIVKLKPLASMKG